MNLIKQTFTIGELETLTGIKAHTIRIWEKRYGILNPERKSSNSRIYTNNDLQKLFNISLLIQKGHKISKIATYTDSVIENFINYDESIISNKQLMINKLRQAMMKYDEVAFFEIISELRLELSFKDVFKNYIVVMLEEIGVLWQINQVSPGHEHFISNLVRMLIISETEKAQKNISLYKKVFVLFTPIDEIHELGLLFLQNQIRSSGFNCIYLGTHVPIEALKLIQKQHDNLIFLTYLTLYNEKEFHNLQTSLLQQIDEDNLIWIAGKKIDITTSINNERINLFNSIENLLDQIEKITAIN